MGSTGSTGITSAIVEKGVEGIVSGSIGGTIEAARDRNKGKYKYKGREYDENEEDEDSDH
jgi:hypothetical protein